MTGTRFLGLGVLVAAAALAACGEKRDAGTAARKADAPPSSGANAAYTASGWKAGDSATWEQHMRSRAQNQNEYLKTNTAGK
jgi:hypothetical protein